MRRFSVSAVLFALLSALLFAPVSASAGDRSPPPTALGAAQPRLLNDYERAVLSRELARLMGEVRAARRLASEDESLAPLREAVEEARRADDAEALQSARRKLDDAIETILYQDATIPPKIKRLQEVGIMLEYDNRVRREQRARLPRVVDPAPSPRPAAPAAAPGAADDGSSAP